MDLNASLASARDALYDLTNKRILITGGTGSFGQLFIKTILERFDPAAVIVLSRDELKQYEMQQKFDYAEGKIRFFLGDVREVERLKQAFRHVDVVVHAAALKQVPAAEYNPFEAIKTNILGAKNVIDAAIACDVEHTIALSTDKAANPVNLYGATKLCSDKLFTAAGNYVGVGRSRFSVVRYGNVVGSRGSVVPFFLKKKVEGVLPITDKRMTRFWITLQQGVDFVLDTLGLMEGGEIFVPKLPSMNIVDLAEAVAPGVKIEVVGIRPGEKLHEVMVPEDDARSTIELEDRYVVLSSVTNPETSKWSKKGTKCEDGFKYSSDLNDQWLTIDELRKMSVPFDA